MSKPTLRERLTVAWNILLAVALPGFILWTIYVDRRVSNIAPWAFWGTFTGMFICFAFTMIRANDEVAKNDGTGPGGPLSSWLGVVAMLMVGFFMSSIAAALVVGIFFGNIFDDGNGGGIGRDPDCDGMPSRYC